jgi:hexosaminidase
VSIIPQPKSVKVTEGNKSFKLSASTLIVLEGSNLGNTVSFFNDYLQSMYGFKLKTVSNSPSRNVIRFNYEMMEKKEPGAYRMEVNDKGIYLAGDNETGVFYGMQTLIQLLPVIKNSNLSKAPLAVPYVEIEDEPRFGYRGLHLDVCRHFMPVDFIKRYIDFIALHKLNYFHWHLTDDQGWRIEIKKYPRLTSVGAWRNGTIIGRYPGTGNDGIKYGGFYTQDQIRDIVAYAQKRYITVVPEIEMPGHASAAIAAYPELSCFPDKTTEYPAMCAWSGPREGKQVQQTWGVFDDVFCAGKENTFKFLEDVMDEVLTLFPSPYIHAGGDECPKEHWKKCPDCQKRIKENKLKDEHELQSYFIQRMEKYLNSKGRTLIGWDEILEGGLAPNAVVMSWRGEKGGIEAAKQKHKVIMTPGNPVYFDHTQSENEDSVTIGGFNPIEKVYAYDPVPKELNDEEAEYIMGGQANMWTEYMKNTKKVEYMLFPRISALSEILWSPKEARDWKDFEKRLLTQFKRYDKWKINYSKAYFDLKSSVVPADDYKSVQWVLASKLKNQVLVSPLGGQPMPYTAPVLIMKSITMTAMQEGISDYKMIQHFNFNKATGKKISLTKEPSKNYPGDGAFTLVNGIINEKGFSRSREFIGFSGEDCEAIIDLGESTSISFISVNFLDRKSSWIWRPQTAEAWGSSDGKEWYLLKMTDDVIKKPNSEKAYMNLAFKATYVRYLKLKITNWGEIPAGNPGAGNKAWLFVDEIEVN